MRKVGQAVLPLDSNQTCLIAMQMRFGIVLGAMTRSLSVAVHVVVQDQEAMGSFKSVILLLSKTLLGIII